MYNFFIVYVTYFSDEIISLQMLFSLSHHTYSRKQIYVMVLIKCGIGARYTSNNYYN